MGAVIFAFTIFFTVVCVLAWITIHFGRKNAKRKFGHTPTIKELLEQ